MDRERRGGGADERLGHGRISRESGKWAEPPGALLETAATQTLPGPALPLRPPPTKMATGAACRPLAATNMGRPTRSRFSAREPSSAMPPSRTTQGMDQKLRCTITPAAGRNLEHAGLIRTFKPRSR